MNKALSSVLYSRKVIFRPTRFLFPLMLLSALGCAENEIWLKINKCELVLTDKSKEISLEPPIKLVYPFGGICFQISDNNRIEIRERKIWDQDEKEISIDARLLLVGGGIVPLNSRSILMRGNKKYICYGSKQRYSINSYINKIELSSNTKWTTPMAAWRNYIK